MLRDSYGQEILHSCGKVVLTASGPEVLNILDGSTKPKTAMKNAVKKTIRQQIGGGRGRTKKKKVAAKRSRKPYFRTKNKSRKKNRKSVASRSKKTFKKKRSPKSVAPARQRLKKRQKEKSSRLFCTDC